MSQASDDRRLIALGERASGLAFNPSISDMSSLRFGERGLFQIYKADCEFSDFRSGADGDFLELERLAEQVS